MIGRRLNPIRTRARSFAGAAPEEIVPQLFGPGELKAECLERSGLSGCHEREILDGRRAGGPVRELELDPAVANWLRIFRAYRHRLAMPIMLLIG